MLADSEPGSKPAGSSQLASEPASRLAPWPAKRGTSTSQEDFLGATATPGVYLFVCGIDHSVFNGNPLELLGIAKYVAQTQQQFAQHQFA